MAAERAVEAFLGLGGNLGDVAASFAFALDRLAAAPGVEALAASSVYRTPPWGKLDQPPFLNMAARLTTTLSARGLLELCLDTERALGRERLERWGPRTIDIDILAYGEARIDEPDLTIPHPRLVERAFALVPLAEIAPALRIEGRTLAGWLERVDRAGIEIDAAASEAVRAARLRNGGAGPALAP